MKKKTILLPAAIAALVLALLLRRARHQNCHGHNVELSSRGKYYKSITKRILRR